jgi:phage terminase large subunit GpA-like protein
VLHPVNENRAAGKPFGYFAHLDPCPILLLQPKEEAAEQFSKERISPLVG